MDIHEDHGVPLPFFFFGFEESSGLSLRLAVRPPSWGGACASLALEASAAGVDCTTAVAAYRR